MLERDLRPPSVEYPGPVPRRDPERYAKAQRAWTRPDGSASWESPSGCAGDCALPLQRSNTRWSTPGIRGSLRHGVATRRVAFRPRGLSPPRRIAPALPIPLPDLSRAMKAERTRCRHRHHTSRLRVCCAPLPLMGFAAFLASTAPSSPFPRRTHPSKTSLADSRNTSPRRVPPRGSPTPPLTSRSHSVARAPARPPQPSKRPPRGFAPPTRPSQPPPVAGRWLLVLLPGLCCSAASRTDRATSCTKQAEAHLATPEPTQPKLRWNGYVLHSRPKHALGQPATHHPRGDSDGRAPTNRAAT